MFQRNSLGHKRVGSVGGLEHGSSTLLGKILERGSKRAPSRIPDTFSIYLPTLFQNDISSCLAWS